MDKMIGVAFALHETFGTTHDIERSALAKVVSELAQLHGWNVDAAVTERIALIAQANLGSPAGVHESLSVALGPTLSSAGDGAAVEALFRSAGARAVANRFSVFPDVPPILQTLAEMNIPLAGLSMGWPSIDQRKADMARFSGRIVFAADSEQTSTPLAAFARVAETLMLPADRIFFVGTDPNTELAHAYAAGMSTVWINRGNAAFPSQRRSPEFMLSSFNELLDVLSGPYTRGLLELRSILRTALYWRDGHTVTVDGLFTDRPAPDKDEQRRPP